MKDVKIRRYLDDKKIDLYVRKNLRASLSDINIGKSVIGGLLNNLSAISEEQFGKKFAIDLEKAYRIGFFQKYVPNYFKKHIVSITPKVNKVLDIGCGTGILAKMYYKYTKISKILGIDINPYPEWNDFRNERVEFKVVKERNIIGCLAHEKPDLILITWTLHHMKYEEQNRYIGYISEAMKRGSFIVVLEDAYSTKLKPQHGSEKCKEFMLLSVEERQKVMSVFDWVANRILAQRKKVPIPAAYRTLEEWETLFNKNGFSTEYKKFIGFPNKRDINTPQSLIIFKKQ